MAVRFACALVIACAGAALAAEPWDNAGVRVVLRVYDECAKANDGFSPCLKKKALVFVNRLSRMDKLALTEGVVVVRSEDSHPPSSTPILSEELLENNLPRTADARDTALDDMLYENITRFIGSRTLQVTLPKISSIDLGLEEGRMKKMKGMMHGMMMAMAGKMATMIPAAIAGLFLLAGKALITSKIALLIAGIILLKKLAASRQGGGGGGGGHVGGGGGGVWKGGIGGGGWNSGGGWDKRSLPDSNNILPYKAYAPK